MGFAKYAQFYKDNGFFAGSKIKATVTDSIFIGQELILSKGNEVIRSMTIPTSGKVEFFTDESGTLTLSADNGTSTISGTVEISAYATYEVTLNGSVSDTTREAYAKDVIMNDTTATANISYTGDVSSITAINSDPSLVSISISGNKITMRDAGNDKSGKCSITATVAGTSKYSSADVTFNVNKLTGTYGSWEDASDEMIASMIARADAGEIDLADYWNIGDTRRVHLNAIEAGTEIAEQVEQDIDLVIMHNPLGDSKYMLTNPTIGNRYQPHFIIGTKDCLENKSAMGYLAHSISVTYPSSYVATNSSYIIANSNSESEMLSFLNGRFISALPIYIQNALKNTNRAYVCGGGNQSESADYGYYAYMAKANKSHKVSLANLVELGLKSDIKTSAYILTGKGVYNNNISSSTIYRPSSAEPMINQANNQVNNCGTNLQYYKDNPIAKTKGKGGNSTDYLLPDTCMVVYAYDGNKYKARFSTAFYIDSDGVVQTNNLMDVGQRTALRGISPIMFI